MAKYKFTFIDLFAGIGGVRIAFSRVGGKCVFSSEIDEHCQKMYENYFGEKPSGDITKIDAKNIPDHDILTGGFPCQAFSIIGGRRGFADTRGTLFFDIERVLQEKRPKAFLLENVRNLIVHDQGRTFTVIKNRLEALGYFVHFKVLNGLDFGVPQKRERIIIVGFQKNHPFHFPTGDHLSKKTLADILEDDHNVSPDYFLSEYKKEKITIQLTEQNKQAPNYPTIWHENKAGNLGIHPFSCALRAGGSYNYLLVNGKRRPTAREMFRLQGFPDDYQIIVPLAQARKQAGNTVVIPKIQAVAEAIVESMSKDLVQQSTEQEASFSSKKELVLADK